MSKLALRDFLRWENREYGTTILLTTHDMEDIAALCSRVMVLGHGQKLYDGELPALLARYDTSRTVTVRFEDPRNHAAPAGRGMPLPGRRSGEGRLRAAANPDAGDARKAAADWDHPGNDDPAAEHRCADRDDVPGDGPMRSYLSAFRLRYKMELQYRGAMIGGIICQVVFGLILIALYRALYAGKPQTLPLNHVVTYVWLQQAFFRMLLASDPELLDKIRTGGIAYDLCRPLSLYGFYFARIMAQKITGSVMRAVPMLLFASLLPEGWGISPARFRAGAAAQTCWR